jgi:hypothetical protein
VDAELGGLLDGVAAAGIAAVHFHPGRIASDGRMVVEGLSDDGVYRGQCVTGISNGGLTAFPGGERDRWEERLFVGAYQGDGVTPQERPVYGGLDLVGHPDGPCPRFGSCHLRLRPAVMSRTTFCFGDSHDDPDDGGTIDAFEPVLAALLEAAGRTGAVLGRSGTGVGDLVAWLRGPRPTLSAPGRAIDDYIEAQVHGPVRLGHDIDAVVADPSFRAGEVGRELEALAGRYELELRWHPGFVLAAGAVPADLRGPAIPVLARRIARELTDNGNLDAEVLGRAARSVATEPERWADHGTPADTLQHIKQLWHVLVIRGESAQ